MQVVTRSRLEATADEVWEAASTPEGINDEFRPFFRMTFPDWVESLDPESVPLGRPLFRSWVLVLGVLPVDYDDITLLRIEPGRGFLERSRMLSQRSWEHERTLDSLDGGCLVTDRVRFEPRTLAIERPTAAVVAAIFRHRHRRLRRRFGGAPLA
jgi:ligand-binding SRPBCC domain-containing protein